MKNIKITINQKEYLLSCDPSEEKKIHYIAENFNNRLNKIKSNNPSFSLDFVMVVAILEIENLLEDAKKQKETSQEKHQLQKENFDSSVKEIISVVKVISNRFNLN